MKIEKKDWDSDFFGFPIGHIQLDETAPPEKLLRDSDFELVYISTHRRTPKLTEKILNSCTYIDERCTYQKQVSQVSPSAVNVIDYHGSLTPEIRELALLSGVHSRFQKDPNLRPKYIELYTCWIEKSLTGEIADRVLLAYMDDVAVGLITLKKEMMQGQIGLIAVSPEHAGKGIGSELIRASDFWYNEHETHSAVVVTQQQNQAARRLYEKNGYELSSMDSIYHWCRND
ncbi:MULTISPECIES: GNAT family N-acetyltransferase [unclassified Lentimonas]|uniref:GNAT family N-acetyltransferase n=1 Tax=unclassified Lentimonas TaxID=2630993 RepID=UPI00132B880E|nr:MULTISPECIES: GNAT family N-acetyltransferase [unclassified Lentimonas]CAA6676546.1 Unannotated [Lentimonas sp. CC4]CAA6685386.1 Unannotated [Lentimonas sp. CC6]CAA7074890.1 Unannotated [Lentimonas sp. CC4]CAA7169515.1 Unannotated [Lentimonas sp. CC21]CAA7182724.1 Unannotated [Lentimonas sp. CC8]